MALVKPFCAYHPEKGLEGKVAALPYDVYSSMEARQACHGNELSFLNIDRPELGFEPGHDMYAPEVYRHAHDLLWDMVQQKVFVKYEKPCYYLYRQIMNGHEQTGIVACASIDDYEAGIIKRHENTRADKEQDRICHVSACNAQTGPIFLAFRHNEELKALAESYKKNEPVYDFVSEDGIAHSGWIIDNPEDVERIQVIFGQMNAIYIADGHHRCASAVKVGKMRRAEHPGYTGEEEFNYFLSVLFQADELTILDYNRVIKDLNGNSEEAFIQKVEENFKLTFVGEEPYRPSKKGEFGFLCSKGWYKMEYCGKEEDDPVRKLDVALLQNYVLEPILGISDPKTDKRIDFVGGIRGLGELQRRVQTDCKIAFSMYPTGIDELFEVADAGLLMPPKSTWFEPKLRSGLYIHEIEK